MIYLGADHAGFALKEQIKIWLNEWGLEFTDCGNTIFDTNDDYPDFAFAVAKNIIADPESKGILACRSATGMVIAANKVKGVRAVAAFDERSARHSRTNTDANVLALPGDWFSEEKAKEILKTWLDTPFSKEERHIRRLTKIEQFETTGQ
jgi:ribose 5-phosphate isomerase B